MAHWTAWAAWGLSIVAQAAFVSEVANSGPAYRNVQSGLFVAIASVAGCTASAILLTHDVATALRLLICAMAPAYLVFMTVTVAGTGFGRARPFLALGALAPVGILLVLQISS